MHRDRDDLPRVLPEFDHLGVYEVDDDFVAPAVPDRHHRLPLSPHYRGPGKACITGQPDDRAVARADLAQGTRRRRQELRDWGDFVHIRHIAEVGVPGYAMITPYENATGGDPRFLHFYEMDTDDPEQSFQAMTPLVGQRIGAPDTDAWKRWAFAPAAADHVREHVRRVGARD